MYVLEKTIGQRLSTHRKTQNNLSLKENGENTESIQV